VKKTVCMFLLVFFAFTVIPLMAEQLSQEEDEILYQKILRLSGKSEISLGLSDHESPVVKCGTPYILEIHNQVQSASPRTQLAWQTFLTARYDTEAPFSYESPGGHFLIHYATEGDHAVRVDEEFGINPITDVPVYVEETAKIFDSVWNYEVDFLEYNAPPADSFYESGGDERVDVYLLDLVTIDSDFLNVYGVTYPDIALGPDDQYYTSFQLLDNDYIGFQIYEDKPLDIIRVTAAHEFFHVIQFGYDAWEFESMNTETYADDRHCWLEMSAVWMEEQVYSSINDYYYYLPIYFTNIHRSLLTINPGLYQYGAVVWPLYLSENWGQDIIKTIWEICEDEKGPNVYQNGFQDAIDEYSGQTYTFAEAISEFYIWIYFTGSKSRPGFGFIDGQYWPGVPDLIVRGSDTLDYMPNYDTYPVEFNDIRYEFLPDHYGGFYIEFSGFEQIDSILNIDFTGTTSRSGFDIVWNNRLVAFSSHLISQTPYIDTTLYQNESVVKVSEDIIDNYSDVVLVLSPYIEFPANRNVINRITFLLNVSDTSVPIETLTISDPFPNPFVISSESSPEIFVEVAQPDPTDIKMQVFTLAGDKVFEKLLETNKSIDLIGWDGKNASGETVASGLYLMYITAGDVDKVCKIAVIE
jgi:Family of unknown function (DUF6055)